MNIITKIIKGIANVLSLAFKKNSRAQKRLKQVIQKQPKIAKSIQKSLLAKENISSQNTNRVLGVPISDRDYKIFKFEYEKIKLKELVGHKLSTSDIKYKNFVDNILVDDDSNDEVYYFNDSSWLIMLIYKKKSKTALIKMKGGKMLYPFYNVPKSKVIDLLLFNGRFMWSYFGKHYSANPKHWIRKGD